MILLDIDHFKHINDSFGHDEGDRALRRLAILMERRRRQSDVFGRWGGEEFLVIAPSLDLVDARAAAERLRLVLESSSSKMQSGVTASFGVSQYRLGGDVPSLIKRADEALMQAKDAGRNCVVVATG